MRETRVAQRSIFDSYAKHQHGKQLKSLSLILDQIPEVLVLVSKDLIDDSLCKVGRNGLSAESVFRCLVLKQILGVSYEQLAFHLSDSTTYRTFTRLASHASPSRSGLQSTIRKIQPSTLQKVSELFVKEWLDADILSMEKLRIDSTVVLSNITPPSDSRLLRDGIRVLSRLLFTSKDITGVKLRFTDQRPRSKSLEFRIFNAKNKGKVALYPKLLKCAKIVLAQVSRGITRVKLESHALAMSTAWMHEVEHYRALLVMVIEQTECRVIRKEKVPAMDKIVSLFEPHTDVIVKGFRDVQYGHKINLSSEIHGFITYLSIEKGNPADSDLFVPVLEYHDSVLNCLPESVVSDGGYASKSNVEDGRKMGVKRVVFNKPVGLSLQAMGVKQKTFDQLRKFRAGIEGNISELKRAFGVSKATWKGLDGFCAYVWSSVISYNLTRMARFNTS